MMEERYVLRNKATGRLIAIDRASGYPYEVDSIFSAKLWDNADDAIRFTAVGSYQDYDNPVYYLEAAYAYTLGPLVMPTGDELRKTRR